MKVAVVSEDFRSLSGPAGKARRFLLFEAKQGQRPVLERYRKQAVPCLVALPVPLKVLWENGREVLLLAPPTEVQELVIERIGNALADFQVEDHRIRMLKLGNVMSVTLHLRPADDFRVERIADLDRVRRKIEEALAPLELEIGLDVLFVDDMKLAR